MTDASLERAVVALTREKNKVARARSKRHRQKAAKLAGDSPRGSPMPENVLESGQAMHEFIQTVVSEVLMATEPSGNEHRKLRDGLHGAKEELHAALERASDMERRFFEVKRWYDELVENVRETSDKIAGHLADDRPGGASGSFGGGSRRLTEMR